MRRDRLALATWRQRLKLLYEQAQMPLYNAMFAALALFIALRLLGDHPLLLPWLLALFAWTGLRMLTLGSWRANPRRLSPPGWYRLMLLEVAISGAIWGMIGCYPLASLPTDLQALPSIALAVVMVAAMPSYVPMASCYAAFVVSLVVSYGASVMLVQPHHFGAVLVLVLLSPVMLILARRFQHQQILALRAKRREHLLLERMRQANRKLRQKQNQLDREEAIARHVFAQLTRGNELLSHCATWTRPMGAFSGDLIQMAHAPNGDDYILLGDFTGHGLPAAMGAVPASAVFRAMAGKGLPLPRIAAELNRKLYELLPTGYFCCAVLIQISADRGHACIHNAGLPPVLVASRDGRLKRRIESAHLPLGVVADNGADGAIATRVSLDPGDCVYAYSDGLTEAESPNGAMWGQAPLERLLETPLGKESGRLEVLREQVLGFIGAAPPSDDIAVVEYRVLNGARNADAA